ncbi:MAG TPA: mechanosensitive ion channel [Turneriella sp.]|nr:mechanosensitive ion channel [Turneriella sp.]
MKFSIMKKIYSKLFLFTPLLFVACLEPRIDVRADAERIAQLKLFQNAPPAWAMSHKDMPQFTQPEQKALLTWLAEGKIELTPQEQEKDFAFVSSVEKLLTTGEKNDRLKIQTDITLDDPTNLVPTQREFFWGNIAPKIVDTLDAHVKFSACAGSILTAYDKNKYYILDGHHRWASCLFVRKFLGKPEEYRKVFTPFKYYEERQIYDLLRDPKLTKIKVPPPLKVTAIEGNPQGVLRVLYELAKLEHGRFSPTLPTEAEHDFMSYLQQTMFLDNPLLQWIYFLLILLTSFVASRLLLFILRLKISKDEEKKRSVAFFDLLLATFKKYIYSIAFLITFKLGLRFLTLHNKLEVFIQTGLMIAVVWLFTIFASRFYANAMLRWQEKLHAREGDSEITHLFPLLIRAGKLLIYFIGFLFVMDRSGYNIYSAMAGLGVGGLALAMAGREAIGHIFAGISLYLDKVVKEGDYLLLPDPINTWGRVEKVGLRSTILRTKYNSLLIVPNATLANGMVNNVSVGGRKRMYRSKIILDRETPFNKIEGAVAKIKSIIESASYSPQADVHFMHFDGFGFYIRVQYYVEPFTEYHDTISRNNLLILQYFDEAGIKIAMNLQNVGKQK